MKKGSRRAPEKKGKPGRKSIMRHSREGVKAPAKRRARPGAARKAAPGMKQQYLDAFTRELPITLKVLKAYPAKREDFKPHDRSSSAVKLAHTFSQENRLAIAAIRGELKIPPSAPPPPAPATFAEAVASYERGARTLIETVREMPESRLFETVNFFTGPRQMGEVSVRDFLWFLLMDAVHHRGQLSVYVRMAGGKVPSIYGPSADEPWV